MKKKVIDVINILGDVLLEGIIVVASLLLGILLSSLCIESYGRSWITINLPFAMSVFLGFLIAKILEKRREKNG